MIKSFFVIVCLAMLACTQPQLDLAVVQKQIEHNNQELVEAFKKGDAKAISMLYTEDASLMPPFLEALSGRDAIEENWQSAITMAPKVFLLETVKVNGSGNFVYEEGMYIWEQDLEGGVEFKDRGSYIAVWKKTADGTWKMQADIWNSNLAPPENLN